jgi:hypothetical protein
LGIDDPPGRLPRSADGGLRQPTAASSEGLRG